VELLAEKTSDGNGHEVTEWTIQAGTKVLRLRACMVNAKVYQAFSVTESNARDLAAPDKFLASFTILPGKGEPK
jgi:hypothetical protein